MEYAKPPSDAISLFDGRNLDAWTHQKWEVKNGCLIVKRGSHDLRTKQKFGSVQLEFATPEKINSRGQDRGKSGVFLMYRYEVQILDSFDNATYFDGQCAGIYKQRPPAYTPTGDRASIRLREHGNPTKFRNIWVQEIPDSNVRPQCGREYYADDYSAVK